MATVLLTIGIFAIFFIFMSVRLIFLKGGKFRGTCASQKAEGGTCGYCGEDVKAGDSCKKEKRSAIEKVLLRF